MQLHLYCLILLTNWLFEENICEFIFKISCTLIDHCNFHCLNHQVSFHTCYFYSLSFIYYLQIFITVFQKGLSPYRNELLECNSRLYKMSQSENLYLILRRLIVNFQFNFSDFNAFLSGDESIWCIDLKIVLYFDENINLMVLLLLYNNTGKPASVAHCITSVYGLVNNTLYHR